MKGLRNFELVFPAVEVNIFAPRSLSRAELCLPPTKSSKMKGYVEERSFSGRNQRTLGGLRRGTAHRSPDPAYGGFSIHCGQEDEPSASACAAQSAFVKCVLPIERCGQRSCGTILVLCLRGHGCRTGRRDGRFSPIWHRSKESSCALCTDEARFAAPRGRWSPASTDNCCHISPARLG
jgi:hypothetical protein